MSEGIGKHRKYKGVIDLSQVIDRESFYLGLGFDKPKKGRARMVGLNVNDFREEDGSGVLGDKDVLVFIGIGMECSYRNIAYIDREKVQRFASVKKSSYWKSFTKLKELQLIEDSGLTMKDRKSKIVFVHPDYFYCGSESMRRIDLNRWGKGNRTLGL